MFSCEFCHILQNTPARLLLTCKRLLLYWYNLGLFFNLVKMLQWAGPKNDYIGFSVVIVTITKFHHENNGKQSPGGVLWKGIFQNFTKFAAKTLVIDPLFSKSCSLRLATLLKKTPTQVFSCKCFKTSFFIELLWRTHLLSKNKINVFMYCLNIK